MPYELKWGGAALLNISLLASDLWTALARFFFFGAPARLAALLFGWPAAACLLLLTHVGPTWHGLASSGCVPAAEHRVSQQPLRPPRIALLMPCLLPFLVFKAGGFQGNSLLFFLISLLIVAAGIALFTSSGDVDTQLGAGSIGSSSSSSGGGGLPVLYHPVPGGSGGGGGGASHQQHHKQALEALEEMQRQSRQQQERGQAGAGGAAALPNPFDIAVGPRGGGAGHGPAGFMPLAAAEEPWTPRGEIGSGGTSPAAAVPQPASPLSLEQLQAAFGRAL